MVEKKKKKRTNKKRKRYVVTRDIVLLNYKGELEKFLPP